MTHTEAELALVGVIVLLGVGLYGLFADTPAHSISDCTPDHRQIGNHRVCSGW